MKRLIPILLLLVSGVAYADKFQLQCMGQTKSAEDSVMSERTFIVDTESETVEQIYSDYKKSFKVGWLGTVDISEHFYTFVFLGEQEPYAYIFKINRYTGGFFGTWGKLPHSIDPERITNYGRCKKVDKLF
jgi:hypothetical protein